MVVIIIIKYNNNDDDDDDNISIIITKFTIMRKKWVLVYLFIWVIQTTSSQLMPLPSN
jgi:hypothetical protein